MGRHLFLAGTVTIAALALCPAAGAQIRGDQDSQRVLTIAARECDDYDDIRANLARNDIQESLQDLGADTLYESGDPVDPLREAAGQPTCRPITGWTFTIGDGIAPQVEGPWGALSVVTDPDADMPVTEASVPLRDWDGNPIAGTRIAGAVTVGLTDAQIDRANRNALWVQGGTANDPVLYTTPPFAGRYGFGALRCSVDDLNGDNVETAAFPSGTRHAFCYAYYVTPPPTSGTIVIRKQVQGSEAAETFNYSGNLSYNPGGAFSLTASDSSADSVEFVRAETRSGDEPWTVTEEARDGWSLTDLACTSQTGASTTTTSPATRTAQITLGSGDTVTCTFTNRLTPPAGVLVLRKVTRGGVGSFQFRVRDTNRAVAARRTLRTRAEEGAGAVSLIKLDPGRYEVSERLPVSGQGEWRRVRVICNGERQDTGKPASVQITAGRGAVCTFVNRLDLVGEIKVRGVTIGGLGAALYVTRLGSDPTQQRIQFARTERQGVPELATGQPTRELPFGGYVIQEAMGLDTTSSSARASQAGAAEWRLVAVTCNGRLVPAVQGRVSLRITRAQPLQACTYIHVRRAAPAPPGPTPDPDPPQPVPGGDPADLAVEKRAVRSTGGPQPILTFRLRVTNESDVTATRVVAADRLPAGMVLVSVSSSTGRCITRGSRLAACAVGDLAPGENATMTVRAQQIDPDAAVNVAVTGSGSPEEVLGNNVATARVSRVQRPPSACPSSPVARAAC